MRDLCTLQGFGPQTMLILKNAGSKGWHPSFFPPTDPSCIFSGAPPGCLRTSPARQRKGLKRPETGVRKGLEEAYTLSPADCTVVSLHNCCKRFSGSATIMQIQFELIHDGVTDSPVYQISSKHLSPNLTEYDNCQSLWYFPMKNKLGINKTCSLIPPY